MIRRFKKPAQTTAGRRNAAKVCRRPVAVTYVRLDSSKIDGRHYWWNYRAVNN